MTNFTSFAKQALREYEDRTLTMTQATRKLLDYLKTRVDILNAASCSEDEANTALLSDIQYVHGSLRKEGVAMELRDVMARIKEEASAMGVPSPGSSSSIIVRGGMFSSGASSSTLMARSPLSDLNRIIQMINEENCVVVGGIIKNPNNGVTNQYMMIAKPEAAARFMITMEQSMGASYSGSKTM